MATILNVDDNSASRYLKSRILRTAGFEVLEAATGESALQLAAQTPPDLVLLDIRLPDISGIEVCRRLRVDARTQRVPIVHISATHVTAQDEASSLSAGADIYLAEPVGAQELSSAVRTLLRLRTTEQGLAATEERLRLATEGAGIATWEIDVNSGSAVWSRQFNAMLGFSGLPDAPGFGTWLERVHADDRESLAAAFRAAGAAGGEFAHEHRTVAGEGGERWISAFGRLHRDGSSARLIGVAIDITARRRAEAERETLLQQARDAQRLAEQAVRMKDEFLAMLSHELRTPMSAMHGWLHLLRTGKLSAEQQINALDVIERNARVQTQLVNDLLDVSRIVTGKMDLETSVVHLDRAVESAVDSARLPAASRGIDLVAHIGRGEWPVKGNPERLQQVFGNLLSNAIKFSPKGGRVEIRLERAGEQAQVSVVDEGEGISPEVLPHVFERFRQADSTTSRRYGGLGLGLAIVRSLTELHGGKASASSAGLGKGATFTVTLPLLPQAEKAAPRAPAYSGGADLHGVRVLVVDDDESNLQMIAQMMRMHGASVMISSDSSSAAGVARTWEPDALILDIGMPGKDGYDLLPEIRGVLGADRRTLPAVALTGFASREDGAKAMQAGFQAHVAKPFDMESLCQLVRRLVADEARA